MYCSCFSVYRLSLNEVPGKKVALCDLFLFEFSLADDMLRGLKNPHHVN